MLCPVCAKEVPDDSTNCPFCGAVVVPVAATDPVVVESVPQPAEAAVPEPVVSPVEGHVSTPSSAPTASGFSPNTAVDETAKRLAIISLACAVGGFIISFIPYISFIGFFAEVAAIVLGAMAMRKIPKGGDGRGLAVAGLVVGIALFAISIIAVVVVCVIAAAAIGAAGSFYY